MSKKENYIGNYKYLVLKVVQTQVECREGCKKWESQNKRKFHVLTKLHVLDLGHPDNTNSY